MSTEVMIDQELLACPICSDTFVDACDTSCGHTFCEFCLNSCLESRPDKCPVCSKDPSPVHPAFTIRSICEVIAPHKAAEDDGKTLDSEKELGNQKYYENKFSEAISHYNNAIDKITNASDPKNCVLFNNRSQCYIHLHQYKRALLDCEEAIRLNDTNVKAFMRKGLCHRQLGNFEESKIAYQKAGALDINGQWKEQITDGLGTLPIFRVVQTSNAKPPAGANPQQQQHYQVPPVQQQQQQFQNFYQNVYPGQQYQQYPQFNQSHARYSTNSNVNFNTNTGYHTVRTTNNPNYSSYFPPPTTNNTTTTNSANNSNSNSNTNTNVNNNTSSTSTSSNRNSTGNINTNQNRTSSTSSSSSSSGGGSERKRDCKQQ